MSKAFTQDASFGPGYSESFTYDWVDRLTSATSDLYAQKSFTYYANNNFDKKENKYFVYGTRPHAVTEIKENDQFGETLYTYAYDSNGNMTRSTGHTSIKINAKKTTGTGNPRMELWMAGTKLSSWVVTNTELHDFTWNGLWRTSQKIDIVFTNGSEVEADLYVDSIKVNGVTIDSTHANVSYDRGSYASGAFDDDIDVVPGQKTLDVEGALRYDAGTYPGVALLDRMITYDYANRVSTISESGNSSSFAYDYTGTRIYKSENGINTYYFGSKYEEQYQDGQPTKYISYYFQNGQRIAQRVYDCTTYEVLYYHTDHLGSAVRLTDTSGNPVQSIAYAPFGETVYASGVSDPKYQYTGQELDAPSGLYYYGARYYAPEIGRFIQSDTVLDGLNRYAYCWNNPMNYTDPSGHGDGDNAHAKPGDNLSGWNGQPTGQSVPSGPPGGGGPSVNGIPLTKTNVDEAGNIGYVDDKGNRYMQRDNDGSWWAYNNSPYLGPNNSNWSEIGTVDNGDIATNQTEATPAVAPEGRIGDALYSGGPNRSGGNGKDFNERFSDAVYKRSWENPTKGGSSHCNEIMQGVIGDLGFDPDPFGGSIKDIIDLLDGMDDKPGSGVKKAKSFKEAQDAADDNDGGYLVVVLFSKWKQHAAFVRKKDYSGKYGQVKTRPYANLSIAGGGLTEDQMGLDYIFSDDALHFWKNKKTPIPFKDYNIYIYSKKK